MSGNDLEFVKTRLAARKRPLTAIARGAGVGNSWLRMFAKGVIPDPSYTRVKRLADYLRRSNGNT
jgi:predicted transcriptional regulator